MSDESALIQQLNRMPHGSAQAEAAKLLWGEMYNHPDAAVRFKAICAILEAASFSGATDFFLSLFPQLIKLKKEHPEASHAHTYVWRIKWLVGKLDCFPEVPMSRITECEDLYENALIEAGGSQRTAIYMRWQNAFGTGRFKEAAIFRESFLDLRRDSHSDCHACEINALVREAIDIGDYPLAKETAEPILSKRMKCAEVPHATLATLVLPELIHGSPDTAAIHHRKGYSLIRSNVGFLDGIGGHFGYLAAIGDSARALRLLKVHSSWLKQNYNPRHHLDFLCGMTAVLELLAESKSRKRPLKIDLPVKWIETLGEGPVPVTSLVTMANEEALILAAAFDQRNGNSWMTQRLRQTLACIREYRASRPVEAG